MEIDNHTKDQNLPESTTSEYFPLCKYRKEHILTDVNPSTHKPTGTGFLHGKRPDIVVIDIDLPKKLKGD